jgi:hypothetical protein
MKKLQTITRPDGTTIVLDDNEFLLETIETPDYILAVSDEEIKEGDLCFLEENHYVNGGIGKYNHERAIGWGISYSPKGHNFFKKIIAYQPKGNAPELDLPLLPEMVVEDDVEKLAKETTKKYVNEREKQTAYLEFIEGYKAATKVYSEEDLMRAFEVGRNFQLTGENNFNELVRSLKQSKTPKWFVAEMKTVWNRNTDRNVPTKDDLDKELKTTTFNGKTYLIGKYIY